MKWHAKALVVFLSVAALAAPDRWPMVLRGDAPGGLIVEWAPPFPQLRLLPNGTIDLAVGDYEIDSRPGAFRLPFSSVLIAIPPGAAPSLRVLSAETVMIPLPAPLSVAPEPVEVMRDPGGQPMGYVFAPTARVVPPPSAPVTLNEIGTLRGIRLARIVFYPALPEGNRLRFYRHIRVEVRLPGRRNIGPSDPGRDPVLETLRTLVLNPQDVYAARGLPHGMMSLGPLGGPHEGFLEISRPGLYRITYDHIVSLGLEGFDPHALHLFRGAEEVAYEWEGDEDTIFEPGELLLFYAEPRFSRWTKNDAYRLTPGNAPGLRMTSRPADPTGLPAGVPWTEEVFEENRLYTPDRFTPGIPPGRDGDRWVWDYLTGPASTPTTYPFSLSAVDSAHPATLTLWLIGHTANNHRWAVELNGSGIGEATWSGKTAVTITLPIPPGVLREGANTLSLRPLETEAAWLDAFAVRHARNIGAAGSDIRFAGSPGRFAYRVALGASASYRAYDVTDPLRPIRLTSFQVTGQQVVLGDPSEGGPRRYYVAAEEAIRAPDRVRPREDPWGFHAAGGFTGADYLIITHPAFVEALTPLVSLRQSQGRSVAVINVLGIYDAYGDGRPDPEVIRQFIADAYAHWNPRPVYVLLVGDGSFDPKQYRSGSPPTFIPPYLLDVSSAGGETAADNRYVCVDGDDNLPDLLLGRLPVKSADEARAVVGKILDYETRPLPGGWNSNVLLIADDPDGAGDFIRLSESSASWVRDPFTILRRYCTGSDPYRSDCPEAEAAAIRSALLSDWNQGALLIQYAGHSSWHQWAVERFFHLDDLPALRHPRRLPILVEATCFTSAFHRPEPTLDEALILHPEGGAVAAWGPTGLGASAGHHRLSDGFFQAVFSDTVATVGEATLAGKFNLLATPLWNDLADTFVLLGDPALKFHRAIIPWAAQVYLPLVSRQR